MKPYLYGFALLVPTFVWAQSSEPILGHLGFVTKTVPQNMQWVRGARGLSIGVPKEVTAAAGKRVVVTVAVQNNTGSPVSIFDNGTELAFTFLDQQHQPYTTRPPGVARGWSGSTGPAGPLQPGTILLESVDLAIYVDLSHAGTYYAIASRDVSVGSQTGTLTSLPIKVTITQ